MDDLARIINFLSTISGAGYDLLKDWQTLIAGFVAILAAWATYRGAVIQAEAVREAGREEINRRRHAFARAIVHDVLTVRAKAWLSQASAKNLMGQESAPYSYQDFALDIPVLFESD